MKHDKIIKNQYKDKKYINKLESKFGKFYNKIIKEGFQVSEIPLIFTKVVNTLFDV